MLKMRSCCADLWTKNEDEELIVLIVHFLLRRILLIATSVCRGLEEVAKRLVGTHITKRRRGI